MKDYIVMVNEKNFDKVMEKLDSLRAKWVDGTSLCETSSSLKKDAKYIHVENNIVTWGSEEKPTARDGLITAEEFLNGGKEMKLEDLKTGYIVSCKNGYEYVVFKDCFYDKANVLVRDGGWMSMEGYNDYMRSLVDDDLDIMKVEAPNDVLDIGKNPEDVVDRTMLWERKVKMTKKEIEELLGYAIEIVG